MDYKATKHQNLQKKVSEALDGVCPAFVRQGDSKI